MNYRELATALYWAACDMDFEDYTEQAPVEISNIMTSLQNIDTSGAHVDLLECLERIAERGDKMNTFTRTWRVFGAHGHRIKESFSPSRVYDWTRGENVRLVSVECADKTGTNDYVNVRITRNTAELCEEEFYGQLWDGIFENQNFGNFEEI